MQNSDFWTQITNLYGSQTSPALVCNQNGVICIGISSLYWFQPSSVVLCLQNSDFRTRLTSLYGSQTSSVGLCNQIGDIITRITCLYGSQPSSGVLCFQHSVLTTRLTSPYGSLPVDLWMQNSVLSTRISSLYGSQPSSVDLCIQNIDFITMTLWVPDLASGFVNAKQRSSTRMTTLYGFQPFTCGFGCKRAWFAPEWQDYIASSHHLWFCVCKTAPLGLELQVSVGQRPHQCFCMQNSDFWSRTTSLYGSQTCPVILCM